MKKTLFIICTLLLCLALSGCVLFKSWLGRRPCDQPGTIWAAEKNNTIILLSSDETGFTTGKIIMNDEETIVFVDFFRGKEIELYNIENVKKGTDQFGEYVITDKDPIECWKVDYVKENQFEVLISQDGCFKKGDKLTFYRLTDKDN